MLISLFRLFASRKGEIEYTKLAAWIIGILVALVLLFVLLKNFQGDDGLAGSLFENLFRLKNLEE